MIGFIFLISMIAFSQAATFVRFAACSPLAICFFRLLIAGAALLPFAVRKRSQLARLERMDRTLLLISGASLFAHFYFFFRAVEETTVAHATILFSLNPLSTAIGAYFFFREKPNVRLFVSCALGFVGIAILLSGSVATFERHDGDWSGLISALCFSAYALAGKRLRLKLSNVVFASSVYLQTALYAAIFMLVLGTPFSGYGTTTWQALIAMAFVPTLLGHALFSYCLNHLNVNFMSCMTLTEPVFATATAWWLFAEPLTKSSAIAFVLTCLSVVILYWDFNRGTDEKSRNQNLESSAG